jgi:hypothetical protein
LPDPAGQTLLTKGIISQDQLNIALTEQKRFKQPLGKVLVTLGFVTEATIRDILSETLGQVSIDLENTIVDPSAIALVPKDMARRYHVLPVSYDSERKLLLIAVTTRPTSWRSTRSGRSPARTCASSRCWRANPTSPSASSTTTASSSRSTGS